MKLTTTKEIEFEIVKCWHCNGNKEVTRNILCPLMYKPVRNHGGKCPHCAAKNKHSHKVIGSKIVPCPYCEATGEMLETKFDNLPEEIYKNIPVKVKIGGVEGGFAEQHLGLGLVGGATDYGKMWDLRDNKDTIINKVREEYTGRQTLNFLNKEGKFCDFLLIIVRKMDYAVYPMFQK